MCVFITCLNCVLYPKFRYLADSVRDPFSELFTKGKTSTSESQDPFFLFLPTIYSFQEPSQPKHFSFLSLISIRNKNSLHDFQHLIKTSTDSVWAKNGRNFLAQNFFYEKKAFLPSSDESK